MSRKHSANQAHPPSLTSRPPAREKRIASFRELRAVWREDFAAAGGEFSRPGVQAMAVFRFGVWAHGLDNALGRKAMRLVYGMLYLWVRNLYGIEMPHTVQAGRRLRIGHQSGIVIHRAVRIGDDCLIRQNVTIGIARDDTPFEEAPVIGDRVQIGAGAVILSPARIGNDVLIGPNAVVRGDIAPLSTVMPPEPVVRPRRPPDWNEEPAAAAPLPGAKRAL